MEPVASDAAWAARLEGDAALLTEALTEGRALVAALQAWRWRSRLRACAPVARAFARRDEAVARALDRALRRAVNEAWPPSPTLEALTELRLVRRTLGDLVARRGDDASATSLGARLERLLAHVVGGPREDVPPAHRARAAQEALSREPGLISALTRFGDALEAVGRRPVQGGQRIPFTRAELDAVLGSGPCCAGRDGLARGAEGDAALARAWREVQRTGLAPWLEQQARRAPRGVGPGPHALVRATFWRRAAGAVLDGLLLERFAPLHVTPDERAPALRYLLARQDDGAARLGPASPRAALLMLAHELAAAPGPRVALVGGRAQLRAWAAAADQLEGDADWRRLRDATGVLPARALRAAAPLPGVGWSLPARLLELFGAGEAWS